MGGAGPVTGEGPWLRLCDKDGNLGGDALGKLDGARIDAKRLDIHGKLDLALVNVYRILLFQLFRDLLGCDRTEQLSAISASLPAPGVPATTMIPAIEPFSIRVFAESIT